MEKSIRFTALALGAALAVSGCSGVSEEQYKAAVADGEKYKKAAADSDAALKAANAKIDSLNGQVAGLKQAAAAAQAQAKTAEQQSADMQTMNAALAVDTAAGKVQVAELAGLVSIRLPEKVLFPSGSAKLHKEGLAELKKVADALKKVQDRVFRVGGHTDDIPIKTAAFPSNWELSSARALAVVHFFESQGIPGNQLAAAGYGKFQPLVPNDSPEHRAQNRRIEIALAPAPSALPMAK
ncbi:MAG TPA: OmpA family protein [Myxococcaceae bacterium]|jgi:chemotaxis protein MotB|nr:OmpA family protein [Myxococcaceae bacterium]